MDGIPSRNQSNVHHQAAAAVAASTSSGKRKAKAAAAAHHRGKKKPPVKVVYIGNPMRVTTSEAGFRALVQELTGRHAADPYKRSSAAAAIDVIDAAADDSSGGSPLGPQQAGALPSPVSTPSSDAASAAGAAHAASVPAACDEDDEDSFAPQLIDNSYCVFSPPTFLYGGPHGGELL